MKLQQIIKSLFITTALLSSVATVHAAQIEVLHYWTSGSEAKSMQELKKIMETKGVTWKDFAVAGGAGENATTALKARVIAGSPPTAAQIKGPAIQEWGNEGVLANIDAAATAGKWDTLLPTQFVANTMKYKGHYVAAPVNVHRVNWLWINPEVLKKAGAKTPTTWPEFFDAADKIQKAGLVAVAHGGQPWQDATIFETVALSNGADFYNKALVKLDPATLSGPTMLKTFDTLGKIKTYIDKNAAGRDWNLATAMVINGKAGMQFMGDWAKGEFTAAGKKPGKDFLCVPAPGTEKSYTYNIDSVAMFKVKDAAQQKDQLTLATAIMSPEFQEIFNLNKGSIPVRSDLPAAQLAKFDSCAQESMKDMASANKANTLEPSMAHGMAVSSAVQGAMFDVVAKFMNSNMTSQAAVTALAKAAKTR